MSEPNRPDLPKFPFPRLPFLAMKNAVEQMAVLDIYKLSKSSRVCRNRVKLMKLMPNGIEVHINDTWCRIRVLPADNDESFPAHEQLMETPPLQYFFSKEEDVFLGLLEEKPKDYHVMPDHVDGCMDMAKHMDQLFKMKKLNYHFCLSIKSTEETIYLLSRALEGKCTLISISEISSEKVIDKRILDYLMDNLNLDIEVIIDAPLPDNYNHENLFKFQDITFNNASWVTMGLLKSMRNVKSLTLLNMNFTSKDINEFISYVTNCEEDVVEIIRMGVSEENTLREHEVVDQLTTLICYKSNCRLIKVRHPKTRKHILMKILVFQSLKIIHLETIEDIEQYKVQLEILELMEKAKDLEGELIEIEALEKQVEGGHFNDQETLEALMERKEAIRLELAEIQIKLMRLKK